MNNKSKQMNKIINYFGIEMRFNNRPFIFAVLALFLTFSALIKSQSINKAELDTVFSSLANKEVAGISACIIKNNKVAWQGSFGMANVEEKVPVTSNTLFMLASVSKTITGTALMHLYDKGKFKLDDDINKYITFKVRNPAFPDFPITFRMLLNHSTSFDDNRHYIDSLYVYGDSMEPKLVELVRRFYDKNGKYYNVKNYTNNKPGEKYHYSNLNYVFIAYLVEKISGKPFPLYCKENLFDPMEMKETGWFLKGLDTTHIAYNYVFDNRTETKKRRIKHYGWPGYADGCLRTSLPQYTNLILMLLNKGNFNGKQILSPQTVSSIFSLQNIDLSGAPNGMVKVSGMGLTWHYLSVFTSSYYYHTGGGTGITTFAFIDPVTKSGAVALITGSLSRLSGNKIRELLLK